MKTYIKKVITVASTLLATAVVSVSAASAMYTTTGSQPAAWKFNQPQTDTVPTNLVVQPIVNTQNNKPNNLPKKGEVKSIKAQTPVAPAAKRCTGDARFANPPVVNNPHHVRNVVWRNTRTMCVR